MAPSASSPFAILYLRPEIATGFYRFPFSTAGSTAANSPREGDDLSTGTSPSPPISPFPGVPADEAAFLLPDGQLVHSIHERLSRSGFAIISQRTLQFSRSLARRLEFQPSLNASSFLDHLTCGPTVALLVALPSSDQPDGAVAALQSLVGPDDPAVARKDSLGAGFPVDQWPLRAVCGLNPDFPGVFASATLNCSIRERHVLFPSQHRSLHSAVVLLLPSLLDSLPEAKTHILAQFNLKGVVVTSNLEKPSLSPDEIAIVTTSDLHPSSTDADRDTFASQLQSPGSYVVFRVVGFQLEAALREILGPPSVEEARKFFPDSLSAQLPAPFFTGDLRSRTNSVTCLDAGIFISIEPHAIHTLVPEDEAIHTTFGIIKPNAARDPIVVAHILDAIRSFGFSIDRQRRLRLSRAQAAAFYAEHTGKGFFERLLAFMTSGEIVALQLSRKLVTPMWRALMGPTNCLAARQTHPWTLRARFGIDGTQNATHGSDALSSARRELRFFFGESPANAPVVPAETVVPVTKAVVARNETVEGVLVKALDALLQQRSRITHPLDACQWLGEWLLGYDRQAETVSASNVDETDQVRARRLKCAVTRAPDQAEERPLWSPPSGSYHVVAVIVDASVPTTCKEALREILRQRIGHLGYALLDAGSFASVDEATRIAHDSGKRRIVVFDFAPDSYTLWKQTCGPFAATSILAVGLSGSKPPAQVDHLVPQVFVDIRPTFTDGSSLWPLLRRTFCPRIVLIDELKVCAMTQSRWMAVADRFGCVFVSFESLVASEVAHERNLRGVFTEWTRTKADLPSQSLLDAICRVIADPARVGASCAAHNFFFFGFPWVSLDAEALENSIGHVAAVIQVGERSREVWSSQFSKRGLVHVVNPQTASDSQRLNQSVASTVLPTVFFAIGEGEDTMKLKEAATASGYAWLEIAQLPSQYVRSVDSIVATIRQVIVYTDRVVVSGFPRSRDEAEAVTRVTGLVPRGILLLASSSSPLSSTLAAIVDYYRETAPQIIQAFTPASDARLRGLLSLTNVFCAIGDTQSLDSSVIQSRISRYGFGVIDLRRDEITKGDAFIAALVAECLSSRCLILGGPAFADHFRHLQTRLGDALSRVFVLKHRHQLPPPRRRNPDDDNDDYDSEEEAEKEKQQLKAVASLSPELGSVVKAFTGARLVEVVSYLHPRTAHDYLEDVMKPRLSLVAGHELSFYREAVSRVCLSLQLPLLDLHVPRRDVCGSEWFSLQLQRLSSLVASSSSASFVVNGFPRAAVASDTVVAPYAADQLQQIERHVAHVPLFVRFTASLDVLLEKKPLGATRNDLEDAQDSLDAATHDLVASFCAKTGPRRVLVDVACDRDVACAQDQFADALGTVVWGS